MRRQSDILAASFCLVIGSIGSQSIAASLGVTLSAGKDDNGQVEYRRSFDINLMTTQAGLTGVFIQGPGDSAYRPLVSLGGGSGYSIDETVDLASVAGVYRIKTTRTSGDTIYEANIGNYVPGDFIGVPEILAPQPGTSVGSTFTFRWQPPADVARATELNTYVTSQRQQPPYDFSMRYGSSNSSLAGMPHFDIFPLTTSQWTVSQMVPGFGVFGVYYYAPSVSTVPWTVVSGSDWTTWNTSFHLSSGSGVFGMRVIPEPASMYLVGAAAIMAVRRRRGGVPHPGCAASR